MQNEAVQEDAGDRTSDGEGRGSPAVPHRPAWRSRAGLWRWAGDGVALTLVTWVLWWLSDNDGGYPYLTLVGPAALVVVATPWLVEEARTLPRVARLGLGWFAVGTLIAFALAADRSHFVRPVLVSAIAPAVGLAASRILRRRWGPAVLLAVLTLGIGAYWYRSFLQWWGYTLLDDQPRWLALSWHNQSGALMAAAGTLFLGFALTAKRVLAYAALIVSAGGFTGAVLSSSRGAIVASVLGAAVAVALALRHGQGHPRSLVVVGVRLAVAALSVVAITQVLMEQPAASTPSPLGSRSESATGNALRRIDHMQAAVGMTVQRPLTGGGPGSYRALALPHTEPTANLTSSAHNEWLEAFAEGGLVTGIPLALLGLAAMGVAAGALRRPSALHADPRAPDAGLDDFRVPLAVGSSAALVVLALHAAVDWDWDYLVLPSLLAFTTAAGFHRIARDPRELPRWVAVATIVPLTALAVVGGGGAWAERAVASAAADLTAAEFADRPVPWNTELRRRSARILIDDGEPELARGAIDDAMRWNPGDLTLPVVAAELDYREGRITGDELHTFALSRFWWPYTLNWAAEALIEGGDADLALDLLSITRDLEQDYPGWGARDTAATGWTLTVRSLGEVDGCTGAGAAAAAGSRAYPELSEEFEDLAGEYCD